MPALLLLAISFPQEHAHDTVPANIYLKFGQPFFTYTSSVPLEVLRAAQTMENRLPAPQCIYSGQKLLVLTPNYILCMTISFVYKEKYVRFCIKLHYKKCKTLLSTVIFCGFPSSSQNCEVPVLAQSSVLTETQNNG